MPIFVKWLTPLLVVFFVALILRASNDITLKLMILCVIGVVIATVRAIIISKGTIRNKSHMNKKDDWYR